MKPKKEPALKAENWEFKKFVPDMEDVAAQIKVWEEQVQPRLDVAPLANSPYIELDMFLYGFWRGCAWMKDKIEAERKANLDAELKMLLPKELRPDDF